MGAGRPLSGLRSAPRRATTRSQHLAAHPEGEKRLSIDSPLAKNAAGDRVVLEARSVVAGYGDKTILRTLDLRIRPGEIYALLGANGAGKTTTLSLFLGFLAPRSGQVRVDQPRSDRRARPRAPAPGLHSRERRPVRAPERA